MQLIELPTSERAFERWGDPLVLEHLLRRYFEIAARRVAPLVRIGWEDGGPVIRLRWPRLPLIAMGEPILEASGGQRAIGVPIVGGLLSAAAPRARLRIVLAHHSPAICAFVELDGYRPRGNRVWILRWLCRRVQAWLHVQVGRRFLRELAEAWTAPAPQN